MIIVERIDALRAELDRSRAAGRTVGFVPTMGAFHEGHRSLMRAARANHDIVVVSLFVNPLQFNVAADLDRYPRDLTADAAVAEAEGVDYLFAPSVAEMYPEPVVTTVHVAELTDGLCGATRPGHFDGVATVVSKLFSIVGPSTAYFGKKDAQQVAVVRRMTADLNLPVAVVGCPLVREPDGVAMSSRNVHLDPAERAAAGVLFRGLHGVAERATRGETEVAALDRLLRAELAREPLARVDYVAFVDANTMRPVTTLAGEVLVAIAVFVGDTRLIDNITLLQEGASIRADLGTATPATERNESEASCAAG
jgi:pantoate--beta-alanine ligase